jgi:hypothetical protein
VSGLDPLSIPMTPIGLCLLAIVVGVAFVCVLLLKE